MKCNTTVTLFLIYFFSAAFCRNISITGRVMDDENNPLSQVSVQLVNEDIAAVTDAQGNFACAVTAVDQKNGKFNAPVSASVSRGVLTLTPEHSGDFKLAVYDLKGCLLHSTGKKIIAHKTYSVDMFPAQKGTGIYLIRIRLGNRSCFARYSYGLSGRKQISFMSAVSGSPVEKAACQVNTGWDDTLVFEKDGFSTQRWPIRKEDDTAHVHMVTQQVHDIEMQMHNLVNSHRTSIGVEPLLWNDVAANYARIHSWNISKGITAFGHDGFGDRVNSIIIKIKLMTPSENVVASYGVGQSSFNAWLSSSGHKENIEDKYSNVAGIGYYQGSGTYTNVYTQIFFVGDI